MDKRETAFAVLWIGVLFCQAWPVAADEVSPIPVTVYDVATFKDRVGYVDAAGTFLVEPQFEYGGKFYDGMSLVKVGGKLGFIDLEGHLVIPPVYEKAWHFQGGLGIVMVDGKLGCVDKTGRLVIPTIYDDMAFFSEGMAWVKVGQKFGFIDKTGRVVVPPTFEQAGNFSEGMAWFKLQNQYGFIDTTGRPVVPQSFRLVRDFSEGLAAVKVPNGTVDTNWGYIDKTGQFAIKPQFAGMVASDITDFHGGSALAQWYGPTRKTTWVVIDKTGSVVKNTGIPFQPLVNTNGFREGFAVFPGASGKDFLRGAIVDTRGNVQGLQFDIPDPITGWDVSYPTDVRDFSEGLAAVKINGKWTYVDPKGRLWRKPTFDRVGDFGFYGPGITWMETNGRYSYSSKSGAVIFDGSKQVWDSREHRFVAMGKTP